MESAKCVELMKNVVFSTISPVNQIKENIKTDFSARLFLFAEIQTQFCGNQKKKKNVVLLHRRNSFFFCCCLFISTLPTFCIASSSFCVQHFSILSFVKFMYFNSKIFDLVGLTNLLTSSQRFTFYARYIKDTSH